MDKEEYWISKIKTCAEKYKTKLTHKEFLEILSVGDATGDGRLEVTQIKDAIKDIDMGPGHYCEPDEY